MYFCLRYSNKHNKCVRMIKRIQVYRTESKGARRSSFSFFIIVSLWYNRDIKIRILRRKIDGKLPCRDSKFEFEK